MFLRTVFSGMLLGVLLVAPSLRGVAAESEPIEDNSFLVEEAYNQEARVVQHILTWERAHEGGHWNSTFTQEWPLAGQRHQISYTVPFLRKPSGSGAGIGDVELHYRWQVLGVGGGRIALAPRATVILPTGNEDEGLGGGATGFEIAVPMSVAPGGRWVAHSNVGASWFGASGEGAGRTPAARAISLGQSLIWLARPTLNFLLETVWERTEQVGGGADEAWFVSPGMRWAHDFQSGLQIVPGVAFPIDLGPSRGESTVFLYLSFEHGF